MLPMSFSVMDIAAQVSGMLRNFKGAGQKSLNKAAASVVLSIEDPSQGLTFHVPARPVKQLTNPKQRHF